MKSSHLSPRPIMLAAAALILAVASPLVATENDSTGQARNVVFLLVDDLGWADVGCNGSTFYETPNIDRLAASGMNFKQAYAAASVCSPTRASIMTGRHPVRVDITDWIPGERRGGNRGAKFKHVNDRDNLALDEVTLPEALKEHGYQTFFAGKWHLGGRGHWPTDQGFDINKGGWDFGSPHGGYYAPWTNPNLKAKHEGEYLTERLTEESIDFLEHRDRDKPFLLYLAYYNVHTPIQAYKKRIDHFKHKADKQISGPTPTEKEHQARTRLRQDHPPYASMVAAVDMSVGKVLEKLDELKLTDDTVVVFFSDNGGLSTRRGPGPTSNEPLRAGKGWLYEGGIREPTIIRAPGVTKPGSTCEVPVVSMDFFPTILDLLGLPLIPDRHADGMSLVPLLEGKGALPKRLLVWHYPHYHGSTWTPGAAIRDGNWKLIEFYHWGDVDLFNLADDPGEENDLSEKMPEKTHELREKLRQWQAQMGARMPEPIEKEQSAEGKKG